MPRSSRTCRNPTEKPENPARMAQSVCLCALALHARGIFVAVFLHFVDCENRRRPTKFPLRDRGLDQIWTAQTAANYGKPAQPIYRKKCRKDNDDTATHAARTAPL